MLANSEVVPSIIAPVKAVKARGPVKCSKCLATGHNVRTCPKKEIIAIVNKVDDDTMSTDSQISEMTSLSQAVPTTIARALLKDTYTPEVLKARFALHRTYVQGSIEVSKNYGIKFRYPSIPEDISERIFFPLVSGREGGSGLGLTLAQTFVQQHQGFIACDSRPGRTDFHIQIPYRRQEKNS